MRLIAALALLVLAGCRPPQPTPDFYVDGVGVKVETSAPWLLAPDFPDRFRLTAAAAMEYAGGSYDDLIGWVVVIKDGGVKCHGGADYAGCADSWRDTITISATPYTDPTVQAHCIEQTVLVHEVVHVLVPGNCHSQPLWQDFWPVADELRASSPTWLDVDTVRPCSVSPSLWTQPASCG